MIHKPIPEGTGALHTWLVAVAYLPYESQNYFKLDRKESIPLFQTVTVEHFFINEFASEH